MPTISMPINCCRHRIVFADQALSYGAHSTHNEEVVATTQHGPHHGDRPRIRPLGSCGPDLRIEGTVFFGNTHRMSHYTKILQPPVDIVRCNLLY